MQSFRELIAARPGWEYVQVYADPGRSGTGAANRPEFLKMIADAKAGKLDVILVKSISRFARNVADAQKYVHELKAHEVEVLFEREAISSFDPTSDMVFSVLAAVAQEESRSISENVKWSYRKHAEKGIRRIGNNRVLGYDTDKSGKLVANEDAWIVRQIFDDYVSGLMPAQIAKSLSAYLGSNQPRTQINDVNAASYSSDWATVPGKLVVTPVVYANQTAIALTVLAWRITDLVYHSSRWLSSAFV